MRLRGQAHASRPGLFAGLVLGAALLAPAPAEAQSAGILIGLTRSSLSTGGVTNDPAFGAIAVSRAGGSFFGVSIGTDPASRASVAVEGAYLVRGVKLSSSSAFTIVRSSYLATPVVARIGVGRIGPVAVHLVGGPTVGFRLTARNEISREGVGDLIGRFDAGLLAGGGVEVRGFTVQVRHEWGLIDLAKNGGLLGSGTMKNRTLVVLVLMPLG